MARTYTLAFTTELTVLCTPVTYDLTELSFKQFNSDSTWTTLVADHGLLKTNTETFTVTEDGVYLITALEDGTYYTTVIIVDYETRVSVTDEVKDNLCGCPGENCDFDISQHYDFIAITTNSNYYLGISRYEPDTDVTNNGSGIITDTVILADLLAILEHIERTIEYIDNMGD